MAIEFSKGDFRRIEDAVDLTRRMRTAGLQNEGLKSTGAKEEDTVSIFADAVKVTDATTKLITSYVHDEPQNTNRELYDRQMDTMWEKYAPYVPFTKSDSPVEESAECLERDINNLHGNWTRAVDEFYRLGNGIHVEQAKLLHPKTGIVAPLSTDFHRAKLHRKYVTDVAGKPCFDVAPALVDPMKDIVVFPGNEKNIPLFSDKKTIGVYIDRPGHGDTKDTLQKEVNKEFGRKSLKFKS